MLRRAGDYHVVGYGENIDVPTIDIISTEINFIGNLVGSYNDLCDLMALAARGAVKLHTRSTRSTTSSRPSTISTTATCAAARSSRPKEGVICCDFHCGQVQAEARVRRELPQPGRRLHQGIPATSRATCGSTGHAAWRTRRNTFWWKDFATGTPARSTSPASTSRSSIAEAPPTAGGDASDHQPDDRRDRLVGDGRDDRGLILDPRCSSRTP